MEGRGPSSVGGDRTVAYLESEFRSLGLRPGNGDSYRQAVPLVSITTDPRAARFLVHGDGGTSQLVYGADYMAWTKRVVESVSVERADLVFVGYGIVAPEYEWNDYEGVDVRGKTVLMLVNDPGFATQDSSLFTGEAMTYYGRWTYKYEEAARQGAAAAVIIHETDAASYPWAVVRGSWAGEQFDLVRDDDNLSRVAVEGWVTTQTATLLFQRAGLSFADLKDRAATREFRAVPMRLSTSFRLRNTLRRSTSDNVVAVLPGSQHPDEYVLYMAHWDHLGIDTTLTGDQIYNGAVDNATGTAGLLLLARAFVAADPAPARSIVFLAVTAEEQGLLGSAHYAANPVFPLDHTVAAINMDAMNVLGPMRDITVVGLGQSELDGYLETAAKTQGRHVRPDPDPAAGGYYRSDHFSFAQAGVPALNPDAGVEHEARGEAWAREQRDRYEAERYHKPTDEVDPAWDLRGTVDDLRLLFRVGYRLANETTWPNWNPTSEFRARRDSMMAVR
jgi:Zn-dependent M28 family amino/carboxypeptidase